MSFSKGIPIGTTLDHDKGEYDSYRGDYDVCECSYPICRNRKIARKQDAVFWDGVHLSKDTFESGLSPLAKLAAVANPTEFTQKHGYYYTSFAMHAECAAEWGMHLIKDALQSHNVGTKLRQEKPNALREQT
jgi:hypothetical protein